MTELFLNWLQSLMDFSNILNASIAASWMVLAVFLLRFILKKSPKWVYVVLWGLVAVRLIMPFSIESAFSLIPSVQTIPQEILRYQGTQLSQPAYVDIITNPNLFADVSIELGQTVDRVQWRMVYMTFIWLGGIAVMLLYAITSYWHLHRKVETAVLYKDNIFQSEKVDSPFVLGIIKPKIYLPFHLNDQDIIHVIAHENAHIKRKDHWWKPLGFILLAIHWFNPVMWLAYIVLCRDIELACDEKVIKDLENEQRADYTQALVSCSINRRMIAACPLAFGEVGVKERVKSVMNYKRPVFWITILSAVACVIVAVCFLTNPEKDKYTVRIVVPAGSEEQFVYSDEEIKSTGNQIIITAGDNLPDTEVILKPVDISAETGYVAEYITHGLPVKFDADKNLWLKVGVNIQNPTQEDIVVYVNVKNVEIRISDENNMEETTVQKQVVIDNLYTGNSVVSSIDTKQIEHIFSSGNWIEGTTDCMPDYKITIDGNPYNYHSDCGTINDVFNNYSVTLNENQKTELDKIIEKLYYSNTENISEDDRPISLPFLEAGKYIMPLDMTDESLRINRGFTGQYPRHDGLDIAGPEGTEIFASADGTVVKVEESTEGDGNHVVIKHKNGYYTLYAHCSELIAVEDTEVKQGDVIAKIGSTGNSTGPHLHFELIFGYESEQSGLSIDPYNAVTP